MNPRHPTHHAHHDAAQLEDATSWLRALPVRNGSRPCLLDRATDTTLTFGEVHDRAVAIGGALRDSGFARGDRVVVVAENSLALALLYFGALYAGVVVVPVNPVSTPDEIDHIVGASHARAIIVDAQHVELVRPRAHAEHGARVLPIAELVEGGARTTFVPFEGATPDDELVVIFTSGTTSSPKGVVHRVRDLVDNARVFGRMVGIGPESRFYNLLSMTYLGGYYNLLLLPYVNESSVVLGKPFTPASVGETWKAIIGAEVNTLWLVPSILSMLLRVDRGQAGVEHCKRNVRLVLCGTAPLPEDLRARFEGRYGVRVYQNYGLSETLFIAAQTPVTGEPTADVGAIVPGVEVRIVDRHRQPVPEGVDGEVFVRTFSLMPGYLGAAGQPLDLPQVDGFFPTGDIGRLQGGHLAITGRAKDLIIRGGVNVSPAAIEDVLRKHPSVEDVAVVGVPHAVMGEDIVAVVQLASGANFDKARIALAEFCSSNLSRAKQPSTFVELSDFPRTTNGKVQKAKLRAWLAETATPKTPASEGDPTAPSLDFPRAVVADAQEAARLRPSRVVSDITEAMSIKYNTRVYELREQKQDVIVLSLGEAFFDIPLYAFDDLPFPALYHYSHSRGIPELRERLATYFRDEYEVAFDPATEILITAGSKIAIYMALLAAVNPNDEVLIHEPAWVSYFEQVRLCHAVPVGVPYEVDVYGFERFITDKTKVIVINNPNNPRGRVYTLAELSHLNKLAQKYNLYVLSDEAYSDFLLDSQRFVSMANLDTNKSHTIVVNSISKNFGISGWRLGYLISNPAFIAQVLKLNQHLVTCPATILEYYIAKHFDEIIAITKPQMRQVVERRQRIEAYMNAIGLEPLPGDSTFYFFVRIDPSRLGSEAFCDELLERHRVCAVPGIGYGASCDRWIRVGVGAESDERIQRGLDFIKQLIVETSAAS